ncbi:MAG TPA: phosphate ABC transporter ATP-binding protein, partial [Anaerolineae bacterium]|nr:phosphate ABC transporter ATP-binding protein [Anaerolineae bacterium]
MVQTQTENSLYTLEASDLDIYYGNFKAVTDVQMKIERNKITA